MDWQPDRVTTSVGDPRERPAIMEDDTRDDAIIEKFKSFLHDFPGKQMDYPYRKEIEQRRIREENFVEIDLEDFKAPEQKRLADDIKAHPSKFIPLLNEAARREASQIEEQRSFFVMMKPPSIEKTKTIRQLSDQLVGTMVAVRGLVLQSSRVSCALEHATIQCRNCRTIKHLTIDPLQILTNGGKISLPRTCDGQIGSGMRAMQTTDLGLRQANCPLDPFSLVHSQSTFVDFQTVNLQERHEDLEMSDIPRHIRIVMQRNLVNRVKPGMNVTVYGIYEAGPPQQDDPSVRQNFIAVVGVREDGTALDAYTTMSSSLSSSTSGLGTSTSSTPSELALMSVPHGVGITDEERFREFSRDPDHIKKLIASIEPAVFGHDTIKEAICCLLFGGRRKEMPDGMRIRGDINILLLGDPGTAKSQFLKFVNTVAPLSVFTSGKGSSAAGLTAAVTKEGATGEWYLEGGAMVLADGGVVCIDEFDKMGEEDRVAIHEAMEQQTISIAKAGITTVLNSRCSVMAAANPVFGSFDDLRSAAENIDFQTTILSRFDLIFLIRDVINVERDKAIAGRVIDVRRGGEKEAVTGPVDIAFLKRYIAYAKKACHPVLSKEALSVLQDGYVALREQQRKAKEEEEELAAKGIYSRNRAYKHIPITVRQLEACVRLSEAYARMGLENVVKEHHAQMAMSLFRRANEMSEGFRQETHKAAPASSPAAASESTEGGEDRSGVHAGAARPPPSLFESIEAEINAQFKVGMKTRYADLVQNVHRVKNVEMNIVTRVVEAMIRRGDIEQNGFAKTLERIKITERME
ncbi:DNA replication licensing factor MCM5 [Monocercomonoides exilis]|uniref:DNA replication licensing factor MCM5 n=1 Tax=Monocercomonoides exilis TaxID=2049356 RepID=UPI003559E50E|nr:DNA replication licensing factor MCM5 [Monocercomonoides exilis]|eukprot:MONOS_10104.1-p1 / transcript=MONOS_10104.1 / gene=MONOS_10104 / organism=Monocercomonoides_exilis_PA203 / gene_product=DNA replication licensing factor MCM5 / transcript_product=DNA replication licensing factor MCM5 / location=Mono_scaffold00444:39229-42751(-) / protein_length=805 / sequence_SO=supercontig / SO=protein_coding / is_pseudo=false